MKALIILGSPRRGGNTETVLEVMAEVLQGSGCQVARVCLNETEMRGCQGCMYCKKVSDHCCQKDGMTEIYDLIQSSDLVIMGTPVYLYDVSGQFKLFVDRCFAFWERSYQGRIKPGKTAVLVVVLGQDNLQLGHGVADKYTDLFRNFGFSRVEPLVLPGVNARGTMQKSPDRLNAARDLITKLLSSGNEQAKLIEG